MERSGKEFKVHVYKRKEKESRQRDIELGYDEDTFEEIFVTNIIVQISWIGREIDRMYICI